MKKIICMALALILCVGLLVGCGSAKEEAAGDEGTSAAVNQTGAEVGQLNTSGSSTMGSQATPPPAEAKFQDHLTILIDDLYTYQNVIEPSDREEVVLLFSVSESVAKDINNLKLKVKNGSGSEAILQLEQ